MAAPRKAMTHELKIQHEPFRAVLSGRKKHEVRKFDRDFQVGDFLLLQEVRSDIKKEGLFSEPKYTGESVRVRVTYITSPRTWGLPPDIGVLSIEQLPPED